MKNKNHIRVSVAKMMQSLEDLPDATTVMMKVNKITENSQLYGTKTTYYYPSLDKKIARIIYLRRNKKSNDFSGRIWNINIK